jgi:hypothetical protein
MNHQPPRYVTPSVPNLTFEKCQYFSRQYTSRNLLWATQDNGGRTRVLVGPEQTIPGDSEYGAHRNRQLFTSPKSMTH